MSQAQPGPVDRLFDQFGPAGRWDELRSSLEAIDRRSLSPSEQQRWFHVRGIVEYRVGNRARAREIFEAGLKDFPESGWLNYGLGQEYEAQGRIEEMARCFQRAHLKEVGSRAILAISRYHYLWDQFDAAQRAIQPIFDLYYQLKIVDDTFLFLRRLPGFDEAFGCRATFAFLAGALGDAKAELSEAEARLEDGYFTGIRLDLEATASGDWLPVLSAVEDLLQSLDPAVPRGRLLMKRAVLRTRMASNAKAGLAELEGAEIKPNDHPWLEDVRTLARAELFARLGLESEEEKAASAFLSSQPLLFEPNHVFYFGLIDYQERVKKRYQARRRL